MGLALAWQLVFGREQKVDAIILRYYLRFVCLCLFVSLSLLFVARLSRIKFGRCPSGSSILYRLSYIVAQTRVFIAIGQRMKVRRRRGINSGVSSKRLNQKGEKKMWNEKSVEKTQLCVLWRCFKTKTGPGKILQFYGGESNVARPEARMHYAGPKKGREGKGRQGKRREGG